MRNQNVLWFEISMIDAQVMGLRQCADDRNHVSQKLIRGEWTAFYEQVAEGESVDIFHHDKDSRSSTFVPALILNRHNIWVRKGGDRLGLAYKSIDELFIVRQVWVHDLDCYKPI